MSAPATGTPRRILAPDPDPVKPEYVPPPHACDGHCHVFGPAAKFPYAPGRSYTPKDAGRERLAARHPNFGVRLLPPPTPLVRVPVFLAWELRRRPVDVLHVQYTAPPFCPCPVVATIHDLAFEHLPETFTRRGAFQLKLTVRRTARRAARIATVSEYSRQDLLRTYGLPPEKVAVTYNGIDKHFTPAPAAPGEAEAIRRRFGIGRDYLLAVGSLQPRKNLERLIRVYAGLRSRDASFRHQLVLVGRKLWLADGIFAEVRRQPWADDVILTDYVEDGALAALYRGAAAFVYPSLFEGFGLPPLEAMACGVPVVTSDTSSLPEVTGGAALLAEAYWVLYIFAAFLIATGIKMFFTDDHAPDLSKNVAVRWISTHMRVTKELHDQKFFVKVPDEKTGQMVRAATPLFLALVVINLADLVFAVDSVPAIFAITTDTFVVYTSNIMAILGLRALYFALSAMIDRFHYLKYALAAVLVFIGSKIFVSDFLLDGAKFPPVASLAVTFGLIGAGIGWSLWKTRTIAAPQP